MVRSTLRKSFLKYPTNKNNKLQQGKESLCQPTKKNEKRTILKIFTLKIPATVKSFGKLWNHYFLINAEFQEIYQ